MKLDLMKQKLMENIIDQTVSPSNILPVMSMRVFDYLQVAVTENQFGRNESGQGVAGGKLSANSGAVGHNNSETVGTGNYKGNKTYTYETMNYLLTDKGFAYLSAGNDKIYYIVPRIPLGYKGNHDATLDYIESCPNYAKLQNKTLRFKKGASTSTIVKGNTDPNKSIFRIDELLDAYVVGHNYLISEKDEIFQLKDKLINDSEIYMDAKYDNPTNAKKTKNILDKIFATKKIGEQEHNITLQEQLDKFRSEISQDGNTFVSEAQMNGYQELLKWAVSINQEDVDQTLDTILQKGARKLRVEKKLATLNDPKAQAIFYSPGAYVMHIGFAERLDKVMDNQFGTHDKNDLETVFVGWIDNYKGEVGKEYKNTPIAFYFTTRNDAVRKFFSTPENQAKVIMISQNDSENVSKAFNKFNTSGTLKTIDDISMVQLPQEIYKKAYENKPENEPVKSVEPTIVKAPEMPAKAVEPVVGKLSSDAASLNNPKMDLKPAEEPVKDQKETITPAPEVTPTAQPTAQPKPSTSAQKIYNIALQYINANEDLPIKIYDDLLDAIRDPKKKDVVKNDINNRLNRAKLTKITHSHVSDIDRLLEVGRLSNTALDKDGAIREYIANGNELTPTQYQGLIEKGVSKSKLDELITKYKKMNLMEGIASAALDTLFKAAGFGTIPGETGDLVSSKTSKNHSLKKLLENVKSKPVW